MKRMKGVAAAAMESSSSPYATLFEDPRTSLKHQSLLQDYKHLYKEAKAQKKKLQMMKLKKLTLLAEVRFLRQRYKYLIEYQSRNPASEPKYPQQKSLVNRSRAVRKEKNYTGNDTAVRRPAPRFDLNRKGKTYSKREANLHSPAQNFDSSQKQKAYMVKDSALRNSATIPDLNQKERTYSGNEAAIRSNTPIFDLNQTSREEEEELCVNWKVMRVEEPKMCLMRSRNDEQQSDMKSSVCKVLEMDKVEQGRGKFHGKIRWL